MSALKKRRADQYEEELMDSTMSPRKERMKVSRTASPTSKVLLKNIAFLERKKALWQQHIERLNEDTRDKVLNDTSITPTECFYTACEHLRVQEDIENLYHRSPGEVVAMGMDDCFQLGVAISADDDKDTEYPPTLVRNLPSNVIQVAAGGLHSAALTEDGAVYTWGCNDDYALGRDGITEDNLHFVKPIAQEQSFAPQDRGQIVAIDAGDSHTLCLSLHGNVYQVGMYKDVDSGKFRDLPPGETNPKGTNKVAVQVQMPQKVRAMAAGYSWNAAILADDSMVTWGKSVSQSVSRFHFTCLPCTFLLLNLQLPT
jgi:regulator of chromosome condensation